MAQRGQKIGGFLNSKSSVAPTALKRLRISGRIGSLPPFRQLSLRSSRVRTRTISAAPPSDLADFRQGAWTPSVRGDCHAS